MRHRPWVTGLLTALAFAVVGCGGPDSPAQQSGASTRPTTTDRSGQAETRQLPTGKRHLSLEPATYQSPSGFTPPVTFVVTQSGWRSTHRGADGFDVSQPDPSKDAPLVALVLTIPVEQSAAAAFEALADRAKAAGARTATS